MITVTAKKNVMNRKGLVVSLRTVREEHPTMAGAESFVAHMNWLDQNRTPVGKYFDIQIDGQKLTAAQASLVKMRSPL